MTGPEEKKLAVLDATSVESTEDLLDMVAAQRQGGEFHPLARQTRFMFDHPAAMVGRVGLITGLTIMAYLHYGLPRPGYRAVESALMLACYVLLPAWGVAVVGGHRDAAAGRTGQGPLHLLRRWGGAMLRLAPVQALYLVALFQVFKVPSLGVPYWLRPFLAFGVLLGFSLAWGYTVSEHVLAGRKVRHALWAGPARALGDLVRLPGRALAWLRAPSLATLTSGHLPLPAYFGLIWILAPLLGFFLVWLMPYGFLRAIFASPAWYRMQDVLLIVGATLGYEMGVGASAYNYLACLAEERPALPEETP